MAIKLNSLASNTQLEADGDWIEIPELPGVELQVRSINYPAYQQAFSQLLQRMTRKYGRKGVPPEENDREMGRLYAKHLLLGWKGFDVEFSPEVAEETLMDPGHRDLRRHVGWAASQVGVADIEFVGEAAGN